MNRRRQAFTLIELLICVAILLILMPMTMNIIGRLEGLRQRNDDRMEALGDGARALGIWRADVALARSISIGDGGKSMQIDRATTSGQTLVVRYAPDSQGRLVRSEAIAAGPPQRNAPLTQPVQDLHFAADGAAWRASWTASANDGLQTWRWPIAGEAAALQPLSPSSNAQAEALR